MNPFASMKSTLHPLAGTARRAVPGERAITKRGKPHHSRPTPSRQCAPPVRSASSRVSVRRTAVRFASQPPPTVPGFVRSWPCPRKRLILNRKIKAQPASHPRP